MRISMNRLRPFVFLLLASLCLVVSCQSKLPETATAPDSAKAPTETPVLINGAGATFPLFLYQRWFKEYQTLHPEIQVNYQPIGSAAGIQQVISKTIDFGASDVAMTDAEIAKVGSGVVLLPMTAGGVAVAYNLPGAENVKLSREVLSEIFLGTITQWNDPKLVALNSDLELPDLSIIVVYRSDGSGTTAVFTNHLAAINPAWSETVGTGLNVNWPAGVGVKSNEGVSAQIQQEPGTIGYVEYSYAQELGLTVAALENQKGNFVAPNLASMTAALNSVEMPDDLRVFIADPPIAEAYPIVTYSWILAYQTYDDPAKAKALREVLTWSLEEGQHLSEGLGYVPLPPAVVAKVVGAIEQIKP